MEFLNFDMDHPTLDDSMFDSLMMNHTGGSEAVVDAPLPLPNTTNDALFSVPVDDSNASSDLSSSTDSLAGSKRLDNADTNGDGLLSFSDADVHAAMTSMLAPAPMSNKRVKNMQAQHAPSMSAQTPRLTLPAQQSTIAHNYGTPMTAALQQSASDFASLFSPVQQSLSQHSMDQQSMSMMQQQQQSPLVGTPLHNSLLALSLSSAAQSPALGNAFLPYLQFMSNQALGAKMLAAATNSSPLSSSSSGSMLGSPIMSASGFKRAALSGTDLKSLLTAAGSHPNQTRSKRDLAILALIFDLHISSGSMIAMTFKDCTSLVESIQRADDASNMAVHHGHTVRVTSASTNESTIMALHPFSAWALRMWMTELQRNFGWDLTEADCPLFVNSQPMYDAASNDKMLRKKALKRDAISKVFQSIKARSNCSVHKNTVAISHLRSIDHMYPELIRTLSETLY